LSTPSAAPSQSSFELIVQKIVPVQRNELPVLLASALTFFSILCGYYILRPVRDEMGVAVGSDGLEQLFFIVFLVMLAAVPIFGWLVASLPRRHIVPLVYVFFIGTLLIFWLLLRREIAGSGNPQLAKTFFVWASVFNLFVVSLFWILMSDLWHSDQAKRMYGFISAGGTLGAITGPVVAGTLASRMATHDLLLVSAAFLLLALGCVMLLRRYLTTANTAANAPAGVREIFSGAIRVWQSPYLFRIALLILFANLIGTYFYLEQSRIVGAAIPDKAARVEFFASRDLAVSVLTVLIEIFLTGRIMQRFGLAVPLAALPVTAATGLTALSLYPSLDVIAGVMVAERVVAFSLANPALKVLYTAVDADEKYKAQNFIDTVVYRGGDAAAGWVFNGLSKSLGLAGGAISILSLPLALLWLRTALDLANRHQEKLSGPGNPEAAKPINSH
jgi:ATP:ADP antiporter, AAA family